MRPLRPDPAKDPTLEIEAETFATSDLAGVIGIDEVGRGAIAGPVAVGAQFVARETVTFPVGLRDSKLLSEKRREALAPLVSEWAPGAIGYGSAAEIDRLGITTMLGEAARRALLALHDTGVPIDRCLILIDGAHDWLSPVLKRPLRIATRVGADRSCASVAAASVRAKVARDELMRREHLERPYYAWNSNKGYGSAAHYEGLRIHGATDLHRRSWIS